MRYAVGKNSTFLAAFAVVTTVMIASTFVGTRDQIAAQERAARAKALLEIFPRDSHDNDMLDDTLPLAAETLGNREDASIFVARKNGEVIGMIFPATAREGYSGDIKLITGVRRDGTVAGVRVLQHAETPGLGDKVELKKSDWMLSFNGKSLQSPSPDRWKVKKDKGEFDQFTGATITPRAVVNTVLATLYHYDEFGEQLLKQTEPSAKKPVKDAMAEERKDG